MAIDGINILESDFGIDIQNEIFDLYDQGETESEIRTYLWSEFQKITDSLDVEIFITSGCLALWQIGMLDDDFLKQLEAIDKNGADKFWLDHFDLQTFEKRNVVIHQLFIKVSTPNGKVRKQKKYQKQLNLLFTKGEVFAINLGDYYNCFIFEDFYQKRRDAYYSFVPTTYHQSNMPTLEDLLIEEIPVVKTKNGELGVRKIDIYYKDIEKIKDHFISVGTMKLDPQAESLGFSRQVSIDNEGDLKKQLEDILQGLKVELYTFYSF